MPTFEIGRSYCAVDVVPDGGDAFVMAKPSTRAPYGAHIPTTGVSSALVALFKYFNRTLFEDALPIENVIVTISRQRFARGFFAPTAWHNRNGRKIHEISLTPSAFVGRTRRATASTLVHELVHCWQQIHGRPGRGGYHNVQWGSKMEALGLMPSTTGEPGGARRGRRVTHYVIDGGAFEAAFKKMPKKLWLAFEPHALEPGPQERSARNDGKIAWACPCGDRLWGKGTLCVRCEKCNETFIPLPPK